MPCGLIPSLRTRHADCASEPRGRVLPGTVWPDDTRRLISAWSKYLRTRFSFFTPTSLTIAAADDFTKVFVLDAKTEQLTVVSMKRMRGLSHRAVPAGTPPGRDLLVWLGELAHRLESAVFTVEPILPLEKSSACASAHGHVLEMSWKCHVNAMEIAMEMP